MRIIACRADMTFVPYLHCAIYRSIARTVVVLLIAGMRVDATRLLTAQSRLVPPSILRFHCALRPPGRHHERPEPLPCCGGRELLPAHERLQNRAAANRRRLHHHAGHDAERRRPVRDHGGMRGANRHAHNLPAGAQYVASEDRGESSGTDPTCNRYRRRPTGDAAPADWRHQMGLPLTQFSAGRFANHHHELRRP